MRTAFTGSSNARTTPHHARATPQHVGTCTPAVVGHQTLAYGARGALYCCRPEPDRETLFLCNPPGTEVIKMTSPVRRSPALFLAMNLAAIACALAPGGATAQQARQPLDHSIYEAWDTIGGETLSRDGRWVLYNRLRYDRDPALVVRAAVGETRHVFERGTGGQFDDATRFVVFTIRADRESVLQARRQRRPAAQMPRDTLGILDLATGQVARIPAVRSFRVAGGQGGWLAYQLAGDAAPRPPADTVVAQPTAREPVEVATPAGTPAAGTAARRKEPGTTLVLRNLNTGEEQRFADVASHEFDEHGRRLAYAVSTRDGTGDGVYLLDLAAGTLTTVHTGEGEYARLVFDEAGEQLAFLSNAEQWGAEQPAHALYHWQPRLRSARRLVAEGSAGGT
jgi:hypothetical protein